MVLRGVDFGPVWAMSGLLGFFGEGYSYHDYWRLVPGFNLKGLTFVAKTTTLMPRRGNMPLKRDGITPMEIKPKCIKVSPFYGATLNAVGLSGLGADWLFKQGSWQNRPEPFFLSFMSVEDTSEKRQKELEKYVALAANQMVGAKAKWGLQINFSCPNVGMDRSEIELITEVEEGLTIASELNVPLVPKFSVVDLSPQGAKIISQHPWCDAIHVSNTIPFKKLDGLVPYWKRLFGPNSPLDKLGGGGLSGPALFPLVKQWLHELMLEVPYCRINAGGGVFTKENVNTLFDYGAHGVSIATVAMHRPWRVQGIIKQAYQRRKD